MGNTLVVSFDVFGTLLDIDEDTNRPEAYVHMARFFGYHGVRIDGAQLQMQIAAFTKRELRDNPEPHPDVDLAALLPDVLESIAPGSLQILMPVLPDALLLLRTLTSRSLAAVADAKASLETLAPEYRLGVCSNTQRAYTIGELRMFGLLDHLEHIVFSSDLRTGKPNPIMFEALLSLFDVKPGHVVHVGDRVDDDVTGAAAVGMRSVFFDRSWGGVGQIPPGGTPVIRSLRELPAMLRALS